MRNETETTPQRSSIGQIWKNKAMLKQINKNETTQHTSLSNCHTRNRMLGPENRINTKLELNGFEM